MIVIKTPSNSIVLKDDIEFAVCANEYPVDKAGNRIPEKKATEDSPKLGDLIIQTPSVRYSYNKVKNVFKWVNIINACIIQNIEQGKANFVVDLEGEMIQTEDLAVYTFGGESFSIEKV